MDNKIVGLIAAAILLLYIAAAPRLTLQSSERQDPNQPIPPRFIPCIAVVRLDDAYESKRCLLARQLQTKLDGQEGESLKTLKELERNVKLAHDIVAVMPSGSMGRFEAIRKLELAKAELEVQKDHADRVMMHYRSEARREIVHQVQRAASQIAAERGYLVVLNASSPADDEKLSIPTVLASTHTVDITDAVLERINRLNP